MGHSEICLKQRVLTAISSKGALQFLLNSLVLLAGHFVNL
jgi:hypothetical protein